MSNPPAFRGDIVLPQRMVAALGILRFQQSLNGQGQGEAMGSTITKIVRIFDEVGAAWVLVGAHAVGLFTEPRATVDVDFVVEDRRLGKVLQSLEQAFPRLDLIDLGPALRLAALDVDLIRSSTHPLFREALQQTLQVAGMRVPRPEVMVVLKFLSAVSPWRGAAKKAYDIGDLRLLVGTFGLDELDRQLMMSLAAQVYPGAEQELATLLGQIERGEPISI